MRTMCLHDKTAIAAALQRNAALHLYALGDLDPFFWPYTTWYAAMPDDSEQIEALMLLYTATPTPTLLALDEPPAKALSWLLRAVRHLLPRRCYAHLTPGLIDALAPDYEATCDGTHHKMLLRNPQQLAGVDTSSTERLSEQQLGEVLALYTAAYPGNWFDPRMLASGHYYGLREAGQLVSIAGVHVFAPEYGVAALGNITTHPAYRGRGLASRVIARLCHELLPHTPQIGLNVHAANRSAVQTYQRLGFAHVADYEEWSLTLCQTTLFDKTLL